MRIAVFGGSGKIGTALLPVLVENGHGVRAMQHRSSVSGAGIEAFPGDIADSNAVRGVIAGCDVVLQMTKLTAGADQVAHTSVLGTLNVVDAVRTSPSVQHYVLTSSDAATGIWFHPH